MAQRVHAGLKTLKCFLPNAHTHSDYLIRRQLPSLFMDTKELQQLKIARARLVAKRAKTLTRWDAEAKSVQDLTWQIENVSYRIRELILAPAA